MICYQFHKHFSNVLMIRSSVPKGSKCTGEKTLLTFQSLSSFSKQVVFYLWHSLSHCLLSHSIELTPELLSYTTTVTYCEHLPDIALYYIKQLESLQQDVHNWYFVLLRGNLGTLGLSPWMNQTVGNRTFLITLSRDIFQLLWYNTSRSTQIRSDKNTT